MYFLPFAKQKQAEVWAKFLSSLIAFKALNKV